MADGDANIKVVVRCRPLNARELARGAKGLIRMHDNQTFLDPPDSHDAKRATERKTMSFSFDKSYWSAGPRDDPLYCSQQTLYDDLGKELLDHGFAGFNACILAYGQTGSGKSYSMMGYGPDKGIIPLTCSELFQRVHTKSQQDPTIHFTVEVAYIEIYNEKVRDLLNPKNTGNLRVREHPSLGPYVEDLSKLVVTSYDEMMTLMDEGNKARTVAATNMNETSSRSHAVFTLLLTMKRHDADTNLDTEKVSRISLVDLAGSERANSTGATGQRLKEGANINKSLTTLGKVISALAAQSSADHPAKKGKKGKAEEFIPYRDSVLTWLLKDSLGGNSKTAMIAAISPADYEETLSTLRYADQAKKIKNKAVVNEDPNAKLVRELKEELETLRARVAGSSGEETYDPKIPASQQIVTYQTKDGTIKKVTKAELQEQMETREKLMNELNETWEDKLHRTQEVQKERERALEELGITVEKNLVGVHTPKKMPHLVNLNEDPLMSECLIYQLKLGKTVVGRMDSEKPAAIRLSGDKILEEHCHFDNVDGKVVIQCMPDSITFLNGKRIASGQSHKLRSGFRIILGDNHVFRFNNPEEVRKKRDRATAKSHLYRRISAADLEGGEGSPRPASTTVSSDDEGQADVDWTFAQREAAFARLGLDPSLDDLPDDDLNRLFEKIARVKTLRDRDINSKGRPESSLCLSHADADVWSEGGGGGGAGGRGVDDSQVMDESGIWGVMEESSTQMMMEAQHEIEEDHQHQQLLETEDLIAEKEHVEHQLKLVRERMKRMMDARARGETDLESFGVGSELVIYSARQLRLVRKVLDKWRAHRSFSMAETILKNAVVVKEANVISNELGKRVSYNFTIASGGSLAVPISAVDSIAGLDQFGDVADPILHSNTQPSVAIKVIDYKHNAIYVWSLDRLHHQLVRMRHLTSFIDRPMYTQHFSMDEPFYDTRPAEYSFVGNALVSLAPLLKRMSVCVLSVPIFCRYTAEAIGSCRVDVRLVGVQVPKKYASTSLDGNGNGVGGMTTTTATVPVGTKLSFLFTVDGVKGFLSHDFSAVHLQVRLSSLMGEETIGMKKGVSVSEEVFSSAVVEMEDGSLTDLKFRRSFSVIASSRVVNHFRHGYTPIEFFASLKPVYLERMERWDEMREQQKRGIEEGSCAGASSSASSSASLVLSSSFEREPSSSHCHLSGSSPTSASGSSSSGSSSASNPSSLAGMTAAPSDSRTSSLGTSVTSTMTTAATATATGLTTTTTTTTMRRSENEFVVAQTHDVLVWMQICELGVDGTYVGVPVVSQGGVGAGAFRLRQGLQRRIVFELCSSSGQQLPWREVTKMKMGDVRMLDCRSGVTRESPSSSSTSGLSLGSSKEAFVTLALKGEQKVVFRPDGTGVLRAEGMWDSSLHDSEMLNRVTARHRRVLVRFVWAVDVEICEEPVEFGMDVAMVMCARGDAMGGPLSSSSALSSPSSSSSSMTRGIWMLLGGGSNRVLTKTSTLFNVKLSPPLTRSVKDLWRLDTSEKYVRGEEILGRRCWKPRSLTVVQDYERLVMTERRSADVQAMRVIVRASMLTRRVGGFDERNGGDGGDNGCLVWKAEDVLRRMIQLWKKQMGYRTRIVLGRDLGMEEKEEEKEEEGKGNRLRSRMMMKRRKNREQSVKYVSETRVVPRIDTAVTKKGHLLILVDANQNVWERRWFVLRRPYLHMYAHSNEVEELGVISLFGVNVENDPLKESLLGKVNSFTLFTASNSYALAAPHLKELVSWTTKLDPAGLPVSAA